MPTRGRRRPVLWLLWGFIALQAIVVGAFVVSGLASEEPEAGYGLRAETMLPIELSVRPDDLTCPDAQALSPVDYLDAGVLAKSLPVYSGDLIAVRILVVPTGAPVDAIGFSADWPASVVGDEQPRCVFVVDDGNNPAEVSWERNEQVGTRFVLSNAVPGVPTEIEIWLTADDPIQGATFQTTLFPEDRGDDIVLDPLGGRVDIDRRPGSIPTLAVDARPVDAEAGLFEVTATIRNDSPRTRSLDVLLRLDAPGSPTWTVTDQTATASDCRPGSTLECSLGDLATGEQGQVTAMVQLTRWAPLAVACQGPPADTGFGLCVEATVLSDSQGADSTRQASVLVRLPRPPAEDLEIRTNPPDVVGRVGRPVEFDFAVSTAAPGDLGSVTIVGTDCLGIARERQELEDGDAFLESGETWIYPCEFDLEDAEDFRFDVAATDADGQSVAASYEGIVRVIDPQLDLVAGNDGDMPVVDVRNSGSGVVRAIAVLLPDCDSVAMVEGDPLRVAEGDVVRFGCTQDGGSVEGAVAYGVDELELAVIGTLR